MPDTVTKKIRIGEGITTGSVIALVPINTIFDYDVGLIRLIYHGYNNPSIFDSAKLAEYCGFTPALVKLLWSRRTENPITLFMKNPEDVETADGLYNEFFQKEYDNIGHLSVHTGVYDIFEMLDYAEDIRMIICYEGNEEKKLLDEDPMLSKANLISISEIDNVIHTCNQFFIRSVNDYWLENLAKIIFNKTIYLQNYGFNLNENGDIIENNVVTALSGLLRCHFTLIDTYNIKRLDDLILERYT